eukprot:478725-Amphidinium_carterae.2
MLGRHLAAQCKDLKIHLDRSGIVRGQHPKTWQWEVEWKREAPTATQLRYRLTTQNQKSTATHTHTHPTSSQTTANYAY